jgi:hypothetical protein
MFDDFAPESICRAREANYFMKWASGPMNRCLRLVVFEGRGRAISVIRSGLWVFGGLGL